MYLAANIYGWEYLAHPEAAKKTWSGPIVSCKKGMLEDFNFKWWWMSNPYDVSWMIEVCGFTFMIGWSVSHDWSMIDDGDEDNKEDLKTVNYKDDKGFQ